MNAACDRGFPQKIVIRPCPREIACGRQCISTGCESRFQCLTHSVHPGLLRRIARRGTLHRVPFVLSSAARHCIASPDSARRRRSIKERSAPLSHGAETSCLPSDAPSSARFRVDTFGPTLARQKKKIKIIQFGIRTEALVAYLSTSGCTSAYSFPASTFLRCMVFSLPMNRATRTKARS